MLSTCLDLWTYLHVFVSFLWSQGDYICLILSNTTLFIVKRSTGRGRMENSCFTSIFLHGISAFLIWTLSSISFLKFHKIRNKFNKINYRIHWGNKTMLSSLMNPHIPGCTLLIKLCIFSCYLSTIWWPAALILSFWRLESALRQIIWRGWSLLNSNVFIQVSGLLMSQKDVLCKLSEK